MGNVHFDVPIGEALERLQADLTLCSVFPFPATKVHIEVQAIACTDMFLVTLVPQDGRDPAQSPLPKNLTGALLAQMGLVEERKVQSIIAEECSRLSEELKTLPGLS